MIGIYKITCGGKSFIGRSLDLENEWENQKKISENSRSRFYNALRVDLKRNAAKFQIITECSEAALDELEELYIIKFDTYFNGWNKTLGKNYDIYSK